MIILEPTEEQIQRAKELYEFGALNGSITKGKSNLFGAIGEVVVADYYENFYEVDRQSTFDYDLVIDGRKVDVKTKKTTVVPKSYYLCSISNWNVNQKCDFYYFCRVQKDLSNVYLLGSISKERFFEQATFNKKGEFDGDTGFTFKDDCWNIEIEKLNEF